VSTTPPRVDELFGGGPPVPPEADYTGRVAALLVGGVTLTLLGTGSGVAFTVYDLVFLGQSAAPPEGILSTLWWLPFVLLAGHMLAVPGVMLALYAWHRAGEESTRARALGLRAGKVPATSVAVAAVVGGGPAMLLAAGFAMAAVGVPVAWAAGLTAMALVLDLLQAVRGIARRSGEPLLQIRRAALTWMALCTPATIGFTTLYGALLSGLSNQGS